MRKIGRGSDLIRDTTAKTRISGSARGPGQWPSRTSKNIKTKWKGIKTRTSLENLEIVTRHVCKKNMSTDSRWPTLLMALTSKGPYPPTKGGRWCRAKWTNSKYNQDRSISCLRAPSSRSSKISKAFSMSRDGTKPNQTRLVLAAIKTTTEYSRSSNNNKTMNTDSINRNP